jgi:uncharacterized membrane protein
MPPVSPPDAAEPQPTSFRLDRILPATGLVAIASMWVTAVAWWPRLPERVPMHFDLDGTPNRWDSRGSWWFLPVIGTVIPLLLIGLGRWTVRRAAGNLDGINVPKPEASRHFLRPREPASFGRRAPSSA